MLSRQDFIAPLVRTIKSYPLRDGREVTVRTINELERGKFASAVYRETKDGFTFDPGLISRQNRVLVALSVCDPSGAPLLSVADVNAMGEADGALVAEVAAICRTHCKLDAVAEAAEAVAKNSEATTDSASPTG